MDGLNQMEIECKMKHLTSAEAMGGGRGLRREK